LAAALTRGREDWPQITPITRIVLDWAGFFVMVDQAFGLKKLLTEVEEQAD